MSNADVPDELTPEEQSLLTKHIRFYQSLARGNRQPRTEEQKHFARVFSSQAQAETIHEKVYLKYLRIRASQEATTSDTKHDSTDGPTEEWFSREDWYNLRRRQRSDMRGSP